MTQREKLLALFQAHGNSLTLREIMQTELAAEYRARMTDLRHEGYTIRCIRGKCASANLYYLVPPLKVEVEPNGQLMIATEERAA